MGHGSWVMDSGGVVVIVGSGMAVVAALPAVEATEELGVVVL